MSLISFIVLFEYSVVQKGKPNLDVHCSTYSKKKKEKKV